MRPPLALMLFVMVGWSSSAAAQEPSTRPVRLPLVAMPDTLAICPLAPTGPVPAWASPDSGFVVLTRTATERSVVVTQRRAPAAVTCERDYRPVRVQGALPLDLTGIVAAMTQPLAEAGVSLFALSTYETDYVLVKTADLPRAVRAWRAAGHEVSDAPAADRHH